MAHKKSLEALNFTLKDLPRRTPADELNACLKASPLWNNVKTLSLTTNMRVQLQNSKCSTIFQTMLAVANGKVTVDATSGLITLTNDFSLSNSY